MGGAADGGSGVRGEVGGRAENAERVVCECNGDMAHKKLKSYHVTNAAYDKTHLG